MSHTWSHLWTSHVTHIFLTCANTFSIFQHVKRDRYPWKETYKHEMRPAKETPFLTPFLKTPMQYLDTPRHAPSATQYVAEGVDSILPGVSLPFWKSLKLVKTPMGPTHMEKDIHTWKETYTHEKRPTHMCHNRRPMGVSLKMVCTFLTDHVFHYIYYPLFICI